MPDHRRVGTFDVLTRLNVAACACALAAAVVAVASWRAGLPPAAAVVLGTAAGLAGALWSELRRGAAGRPRAIAALYAGWALLVGPIAWLVVAWAWGVGGV